MFIRRACLLLLLLLIPAAADAQRVRGRVIDDASRQALPNTAVELLRGDSVLATAGTDAQGFYGFAVPGAGEYRVRVQRVGYAEAVQSFRAPADDREVIVPAIVLKSEAIRMQAVEATADRETSPNTYAGFPVGRPMNRLAGARLANLERMGVATHSAIRELGAGLRVRTYTPPGKTPETCIETTRRTMDLRGGTGNGACENVALIIDGINMGPADHRTVRGLRLSDYESIEFITPLEAGQRWGFEASARGALVLWSRNSGPHRSAERNGGG